MKMISFVFITILFELVDCSSARNSIDKKQSGLIMDLLTFLFWLCIIIGLTVRIFFTHFGSHIQKKYQRKQRSQQHLLQLLMENYQKRMQSYSCKLEPAKQQQLIDWFTSKDWILKYYFSDGASEISTFKIINLVNKNNYMFQITVQAKGPYGDDCIHGYLSVNESSLEIFFFKPYYDQQVQRTGVLIFDGKKSVDKFEGKYFWNQGNERTDLTKQKWLLFYE